MQYVFDTRQPPALFVEIGSGNVEVTTADIDQTTIEVSGTQADEVTVEQRGNDIVVIAPKRIGFFGGSRDLRVEARVPIRTALATRLGSADLVAIGTLGPVKVNNGSGDATLQDVAAEALVKTGSGDITIRNVEGSSNIGSGSGNIRVERLQGPAQVSSGSGDVEIGYAGAPLSLKSGSGDLKVHDATDDLALASGSGDLLVDRFPAGKLTAKNASGDIRVGIPAGVPVWTDITSVSGRVHSTLEGAGQPGEGQEYVELRAKTVSGDVVLQQI